MTAQDTIPEDIMLAAKCLVSEWEIRSLNAEHNDMVAAIARAILAERQRCEKQYGMVGWVTSMPSPRIGVETFFSQFEPTGNVKWSKAYVRRDDLLSKGGAE